MFSLSVSGASTLRAISFSLALLVNATALHANEPTPQALLFDAPYLTELQLPTSLNYTYAHATSQEKLFGRPFEDTISVNVNANENAGGLNSVMLRVFSGERERNLGPHLNMKGNPIIMIFLERDMWEMKRRVGGEPIYYRNKIRKAFRDAATVEKTSAEFNGHTIEAHKISITPFADEKDSRRMQHFLNKGYEFMVSDKVPGGILSVRSVVRDKDATLIEDRLTFVGKGQ